MEDKIILLSPEKHYYKVNLHTHSVLSDGKLTPEEVKSEYKARGYSAVALTDHSLMSVQQHLNDEDFIFLTGVEVNIPNAENKGKTYHLNLISKDPQLLWVPVHDPDMLEHMPAHFEKCKCDEMPLDYTVENVNSVIKRANEMGCLVIYNHPEWSLQFHEEYAGLEGLWGMEYRNSSCAYGYGLDTANEQVFREMLQKNNRLVPVMADDMHKIVNPRGYETLGKSWTMVAADELSYDAIMDGLERRELYSSCGPEIHSIVLDGTNLTVTCSPAASIQCIAQHRRGSKICFAEDRKTLTEATFDLSVWARRFGKAPDRMLRVIVTAPDGSYAVSRAYTAEDL